VAIGEYTLPTPNSYPQGLTVGPDGAVWFTEFSGDKIGRLAVNGASVDYPIPTSMSRPLGITVGPDNNLWFTEWSGSKIGRITTAGVITEWPIPTANGRPWGIVTGPDGNLWFTESFSHTVGHITTAGVITEMPESTTGYPTGITVGPDGALWFGEYPNSIGRMTTAGALTEYATTPEAYPGEITSGPDGALWFTENSPSYYWSAIGRITTGGVLNEYSLGEGTCEFPNEITTGPDGALWFGETNTATCTSGAIGRITTSGVISQYTLPATGSSTIFAEPFGIILGPGNELWYTDQGTGKIGEMVFPTANMTVNPTSGFFGTEVEFNGSGFTANESVIVYSDGIGSPPLVTTKAGSTGSFLTGSVVLPAPLGPRLYLAKGQTSGKLAAADFSVRPRVILKPNSAAPGSSTTATGLGFGSAEMVKVYWYTPLTFLGETTANQLGTFPALPITVPLGAPSGTNYVFGVGQATGVIGTGAMTVP
jgi:streptogramin lyase